MSETTTIDGQRRRFLTRASAVVSGVGLIGAGYPFAAAWQPSARARAAGAPVTVDISKLEPDQQLTIAWRGKPIWILRRNPAMLDRLQSPDLLARLRDPESRVDTQQPVYAKNPYRAIKAQYLIVIGICTHLGCVPTFRPELASPDLGPDWSGGYFCPCHGSRFDLAGRVFKNVPAPTNLVVPPHRYLTGSLIEIGVDERPT